MLYTPVVASLVKPVPAIVATPPLTVTTFSTEA